MTGLIKDVNSLISTLDSNSVEDGMTHSGEEMIAGIVL